MGCAPIRRASRAAMLGASALALLSGCEAGGFGASGRDAEWLRRGDFAVISASPSRAVLSASGQPVAVEPPPGFCLAENSIETSDRSAFVLIGDCVLEDGAAMMPGADGALEVPSSMPGVITVSVSGDPGFASRGASTEDLSELERYLETAEGRALLGRGGEGAQVSVIDMRRDGRTLYVLVEDSSAEAMPLLAPRFWRAFVELNDRLAVVTVSGFRDLPMQEDEMLRHLGDQVRQLQLANAAPFDDAPVQFAEAPPAERLAQTGPPDGVPAETGPAEPATSPARPSGAAPAVAGTATGEAFASAVAEDHFGPDDASGDDWLALGDRPEGDDPSGATGGLEPIPGWAELTEDDAATDEWPRERQAGQAAPQPLAIASNTSATSGAWPMPSERPLAAGAKASPQPMERPVASVGGPDVPLPPAPPAARSAREIVEMPVPLRRPR